MSLKLGTTDISGVPTTLINTVNNKLDASTYISNPRTNAVYITQTYHNGSSWYRVWSDGFIEQGGNLPTVSGWANTQVSLVKTMTSTNYTVVLLIGADYASGNDDKSAINTKDTTYFKAGIYNKNSLGSFYVCGY